MLHIWSQYEKSFSRYYEKAFPQQLMVPPQKQTLLSNTYKKNIWSISEKIISADNV